MIRSTRFIIIQEGIACGLIGAILKTIFTQFPIVAFYGFLGPIIIGIYGIKTYQHIKNGGKDGND